MKNKSQHFIITSIFLNKDVNFELKSVFLKTLHILFLLCIVSIANAQQSPPVEIKRSTKIELIEGTKYFMHTVEAGQTVYSIAKAYEINPKDLIFENPEVVDGVALNQVLKIPVKTGKKPAATIENKSAVTPSTNFSIHTVEKQQTLYSISKMYAVNIDEITKANPEIADGLKIGMQLKIPQASAPNALPAVKVGAKEEPETEATEKVVVVTEKNFSIALLLPFNTDDIDTTKFEKNTKTAIPSKSYAAIEFYEGFQTAMDSLKNKGLHLKLYAFDAPNDSLRIVSLLEKPQLRKMDMLVGPFHNMPAALVAAYAKRNHIPNVIPYAQQNKLLLGNPYAIKVSASSGTQIDAVAEFILTHYKKQNILVLHNALFKEKSSVQVFKEKLNTELGKDSINEVIFKTAGAKGLQAKLSSTKDNIIFIPSNDQAFVTSLVNSLRTLKKDYKIILFGMESWISFDNLDINTIQDLQLHLPSSNAIRYDDFASIEMMKKYRNKFKTDPSKYAFQGYDCGMYFVSLLENQGKDFVAKLPENKKNGLQCNFQFIETAVESGYENKSVFILQYKDFSLSPEK